MIMLTVLMVGIAIGSIATWFIIQALMHIVTMIVEFVMGVVPVIALILAAAIVLNMVF